MQPWCKKRDFFQKHLKKSYWPQTFEYCMLCDGRMNNNLAEIIPLPDKKRSTHITF